MKFRRQRDPASSAPRKFLAVDFDSQAIRAILVTSIAGKARLKSCHTALLGSPDEPPTPEIIGQALRELIEAEALPDVPLVMSVPRGKAILKPLRLPPGTAPEEIAAMVQFQVQGEIPFPPDETVLDHTVEGPVEDATGQIGVDVLAAAVRSDVLEEYRRIAEAAGRRLQRLGLRPYANVRCIEAEQANDPAQTTALIYLTADETEIDVLEGEHLAFCRSAVIDLTQDDPARAIVAEVERTLQGYSAQHDGRRPDRLLVAGDTGMEADVVSTLRTGGLAVEFFTPELSDGVEAESASGFLSAAGLARGARGPGKTPFDFLSPKKPPQHRNPQQDRTAAIAAAVIGAVLLLAVGGWWYLGTLRDEVEFQLRKKKDLARKVEKTEALIKRVDPIIEWVDESVGWLDHLRNLTVILPDARDVYIDQWRTGKDFVQFTARARDSVVVDRLVKDLQEAGYAPKTNKDGLEEDNPFGYVRHTEISVFVPTEWPEDLMVRQPPPRPADDDLDWSLDEARHELRRARQQEQQRDEQ
jgi:Tfp pilus assembly PilM family ATPase